MVWNGQEISDPALLPPHLRPLLEDLDGDGIPDLAQQGPVQRPIIYNDKLYRNLDEVPPELRAEVEAAIAEAEGASTSAPVETTTVRIRQSPGSDAPTEIEVGGHSYTSIDQVPAEHRALVERAMNAVPALPPEIEINGRRYASIDEVPVEYRALVRRAMESSPGLAAGPATVPAATSRPGESALPDPFSLPPSEPRPAHGISPWWLLLAAMGMALVVYLCLR
jgi:hypothetical protein